jgi:hypothetical protein
MSKFIPLLRVLENGFDDEDEDIGLPKEVGDAYPTFEFEPFGSVYNRHFVLVKVQGEFIGTLLKKMIKWPDTVEWYISFLKRRDVHTRIRVESAEEGAQKIWQDHIGITELPEIPQPYEPLPPVEGEPDHYENLRQTAKSLVAFLAEDVEDPKSEVPEPIQQLQTAGFKITEHIGNKARISWPADNQATYFSGVRRAKEILPGCLFTESRHKNNLAELTVIFK